MNTLNFKPDNGAFLCFRCGSHGSWYDFVRFVLGDEVNFEKGPAPFTTSFNESGPNKTEMDPQKIKSAILESYHAYNELLRMQEVMDDEYSKMDLIEQGQITNSVLSYNYLTGTEGDYARYLTPETLQKFAVGIGEQAFRNEEGTLKRVPVVFFPYFKKNHIKAKNYLETYPLTSEDFSSVKYKIRGAHQDLKHFMRFQPSGAQFGVFGLNILAEDSTAVVITEGEFDAMAVYQATNLPSISLPSGASSLPLQLLPYIEKVERIYLWMDNDEIGQINLETFANKLGVNRTYIVRVDPSHGVKDANDCLRKDAALIREAIMQAKTMPSQNIVSKLSFRHSLISIPLKLIIFEF